MASEKGNVEASETNSSYFQDSSTEQQAHGKQKSREPHFAKALAYRALYSSSTSHHGGARKVRDNDGITKPSRLSKVSSADEV